MDEEPQPKTEPWELPEKKEGYDVYNYNAEGAARGQRIVVAIFIIALLFFIAYGVVSCRRAKADEQIERQYGR